MDRDRDAVLALYRQLSPEDPELATDQADAVWAALLASDATNILVVEVEGMIVSTCTITVAPNLTRNARPYALIENVVTDAAHRKRGFGSIVLKAALDLAWAANAYKVMLATGSKRESTLRFYEASGFERNAKTFFQARRT